MFTIFDHKVNKNDQLVSTILNLVKKYRVNISENFSMLVNSGPGSFSSIRVSLTVAKGIKISKKLGYKVICDFRVQDINLGGQGAPLVPVGEKYLFSDYNSFLNLGGFANITKTIKNKIIAYDICPTNIVFNSLCNKIELEYDNNGDVAASGKINKALHDELQSLKFYSLPYPKSLSAEWVNEFIEPILSRYHKVAVNDLLNTFSNHFADQIVKNNWEQG